MARLTDSEVYRQIKPVDLAPALSVLDALPFVAVGQSSPDKYRCDVVLRSAFPAEVNQLIESLGLGGETARAIIRRLSPGQHIPPHIDQWMPQEADWRRFQVPLVSHPDVIMAWPDDGVAVHLAPGFLYEVRFDRLHAVAHNGDCDRVHLQIDQINATI